METFLNVLLDVLLVALIGVFVWLTVATVNLVRGVKVHAKRIYERPVRAATGIASAAKGAVLQGSVRVVHIRDTAVRTSGVVVETATDLRDAVQSLPIDDAKDLFENAKQSATTVNAVKDFVQAIRKQGASKAD